MSPQCIPDECARLSTIFGHAQWDSLSFSFSDFEPQTGHSIQSILFFGIDTDFSPAWPKCTISFSLFTFILRRTATLLSHRISTKTEEKRDKTKNYLRSYNIINNICIQTRHQKFDTHLRNFNFLSVRYIQCAQNSNIMINNNTI